jgi:putative phosphoesterase
LHEVDEIWHAGDIGDSAVITALQTWKPVRAVFGNIDDAATRSVWPEDLWFEIEGLTIWMTHIAGAPPRYNPRIKKQFTVRKPDVLICGHSHICRAQRDENSGLIYLNPGAAGNHGFHRIKTMMRFSLKGGKLEKLEVIELGKRGQLS